MSDEVSLTHLGILPGIFPLAFSDIPLNCEGTASSTVDDTDDARDIDDARDGSSVGVDAAGVRWSSSVSSSSSSPIAKVPSSGTSLNAGAR
jgi:hypothetical protein